MADAQSADPVRMKKRFYTPEEVAEILCIDAKTLYKWRYADSGPPVMKMGKYLRYPVMEFERWVASATSAPAHRLPPRTPPLAEDDDYIGALWSALIDGDGDD